VLEESRAGVGTAAVAAVSERIAGGWDSSWPIRGRSW